MAKRKKEEEEHDEFIVLFTALSMILLAFFILLNTMAVLDPMRSQKAMDSLVGTFGIMQGNQEGEPMELSSKQTHANMVMALIAEFNGDEQHPGMNVKVKKPGVVSITMHNDVLFAPGGWHIDPSRFATLDHIVTLMSQDHYVLRVVGHTDATRSASISNMRLSAARAAAVRRYMEHALGEPPGSVHSLGVGSSQPHEDYANPNDPRHRRVEIFIEIPPPKKGKR